MEFLGTYAGTKRALELVAGTLRLELAPFHVRVLSVVTGAVKTNGQTYFGDFKLPDDSLYKPIEETIATRARGGDGRPREDLTTYSNKVVSEITGGKSGKIWYGENAGSVKFVTGWLPEWVMVSEVILARLVGDERYDTRTIADSFQDNGVVKDTGLDVLTTQNKN